MTQTVSKVNVSVQNKMNRMNNKIKASNNSEENNKNN